VYGLAAGGEAGVDRALTILRDEVSRGLGLLGCRSIRDIARHHVSGSGRNLISRQPGHGAQRSARDAQLGQ
jgi:isopentenyl diphosphate isomerase/L-lactate dehydrogenase-like FMN-dependent dehydrogenase